MFVYMDKLMTTPMVMTLPFQAFVLEIQRIIHRSYCRTAFTVRLFSFFFLFSGFILLFYRIFVYSLFFMCYIFSLCDMATGDLSLVRGGTSPSLVTFPRRSQNYKVSLFVTISLTIILTLTLSLTLGLFGLVLLRTSEVWLSDVVVSALGMRTRRPRFESRVAPLFHWVATLGKLFIHTFIASPVSQFQETGVQKGVFGA